MKSIRQLFGGDFRQFGMIGALIAIMVFFHFWTGGKVFEAGNLMNLLSGNSYVLILAIGMVLVIIAGHIDLSVGSVAAFVGIIVALAMKQWGIPAWAGLLLGLVVGLLVGAWQGFWVAYVGIPAFIVTLAGMLIFRGGNQYIGKSLTVPVPDLFQYLGAGYLPDMFTHAFNLPTMLFAIAAVAALAWRQVGQAAKLRKYGVPTAPWWVTIVQVVVLSAVILVVMYTFATGRKGTSFPVPGLILVVLILAYSFLSQRTVLGRHIYAVGGNSAAAALSGVSTRKINFFVICNMSVLAAVAGMVFIGRSTASGPSDGVMWELDAIAAVFIGGAAVTGGIGTVMGTMVGGLVMASLNNGLQLTGVGADTTQIIKGLVLLLAVAIDVYSKRQGRRSIIGMFQNASRRNKLGASADMVELAQEVSNSVGVKVPTKSTRSPGASSPSEAATEVTS